MSALAKASAARLPASQLAGLAPFRARSDVKALVGESLWVFFTAGDLETARALLALPGAELFSHDDEWRPLGKSLPVFDVPDPDEARELSRLVFPSPAVPRPPEEDWRPLPMTLVRGGGPQPITALKVGLKRLVEWAAMATRHDLAGFKCAVSGSTVLLVGERLPPLPGEAFWGDGLFVLAGWRPEPALPLPLLREAFGVRLALWTPDGMETVDALDAVSLPRLRLALEAA